MTRPSALSQSQALADCQSQLDSTRKSLSASNDSKGMYQRERLAIGVMMRQLWLLAMDAQRVVHRVSKAPEHKDRRYTRCTAPACHDLQVAWEVIPLLMQVEITLREQKRWPG